jgi:hypothetical protein
MFALVVILGYVAGGARAQQLESHEARVKSALSRIFANRDFKPGNGCTDLKQLENCDFLIDQLRAGTFSVVEPIESSDRPDMPSYRLIRAKCDSLDPLHMRASHHVNVATRNFAMYRLNVAKRLVGGDEILVFRGMHYVVADEGPIDRSPDARAVWPGQFVAIGVPSCRQFSNATAQEGDKLAKHNLLRDDDYLAELVKIDDRYFVLNLDPVAGPNQPRVLWGYDLELWDWGVHADADLRHDRHLYVFSARPSGNFNGRNVNGRNG